MSDSPATADDPGALADVVCIFADGRDWHVRQILNGLQRCGIDALVLPLERVAMAIGGGAGDPIRIPGLDGRLPRAAFVRSISAGSFEAVTLRLGVLHGLERAGVTVWNRARAIEVCVDKSATSLAIARAGLPTPATFVSESFDAAAAIVAAETAQGRRLVWKPLFGAQGKGLRLIAAPADLPDREEARGVYYLQRFVAAVPPPFRDYRVLVCGGRVIAGMQRTSDSWVTNVHQGGTPEAWWPDAEAAALAVAAARVTGADFAGVDLIGDGDGGMLVLEVNSMPAWSGLQTVTDVDIGAVLAGALADAAGLVR